MQAREAVCLQSLLKARQGQGRNTGPRVAAPQITLATVCPRSPFVGLGKGPCWPPLPQVSELLQRPGGYSREGLGGPGCQEALSSLQLQAPLPSG